MERRTYTAGYNSVDNLAPPSTFDLALCMQVSEKRCHRRSLREFFRGTRSGVKFLSRNHVQVETNLTTRKQLF
jgi:hypothetical protein